MTMGIRHASILGLVMNACIGGLPAWADAPQAPGVAIAVAAPGTTVGGAQAAASGPPRPMTIVDLIDVPRLSDPQLSPDGRHLLFVRSDADWKANRRVTHVWRAVVATGELTQLTTGAEGEYSPRWSPDGRRIAFIAKRAGDDVGQIYLLAVDGGEATRLTTHETAPTALAWLPGTSAIVFVAPEAKTAAEKAREKLKDDIYAFDEDYKQTHLWRVDAGSAPGVTPIVAPGQPSRLTEGDFAVGAFEVSRDGRRIVHARAPNPLPGVLERSELWVMDADGRHAAALTSNAITEANPSLSPDGAEVLFTASASASFEPYHTAKVFAVAVGGGPSRVVTPPDFVHDVERAEWSRDGRQVYFVANTGVRSQLYAAPAAGGAARPLTAGDHAILGWNYFEAADRHVFGKDETTNPGDLYVLGATGDPARVTRVFDWLAREYHLPRVEVVSWTAADGATIEGLLTYPLDHRPGTRVPLVVQTHGGPAASDKFGFGTWVSYTTVLAAKGYAVLKPNYRGSTGYGDAFLRDVIGHYFKHAHLDVLAGVDAMIARGIADPDRLVKMGWSAGGHMTNKIITVTDRFTAASSGAGAANWVSMFGQSDMRSHRALWFGGTPWQADAPIATYWEHSPLRDVAKVRTPTIFIVGDKDARVPMAQSIEMHRALRSHGVPTRLYVAPREPHGFVELRHQLFKVNAELEWFERWVAKRPYTWETAPAPDDPRPAR
jgi:dipeptidyl aminopeptidase/acylaminoacyl peptidase